MVLAGILNDTLFYKSHYLVVVILNLITIIWNFLLIFIPHRETDYIKWSLAIFGINNTVSELYLMIIIPMKIADKNRCFAYELTMTGTLLATINLCYYISTAVLA